MDPLTIAILIATCGSLLGLFVVFLGGIATLSVHDRASKAYKSEIEKSKEDR